MKTLTFSCQLFVAHSYKGSEKIRDAKQTLTGYIRSWVNKSMEWAKEYPPLKITKVELVKENCKSGKHDGFATGNLYKVTGHIGKVKTLHDTRFKLFHCVRNDYFCAFPVLFNSIKFIQ